MAEVYYNKLEAQLEKLENPPENVDVGSSNIIEFIEYRLPPKYIKRIAQVLKENKLIKLVLSSVELSSSSAQDIAEGLKANTSLKVLDLSFNFLGDSGVSALCSVLKFNTNVEELYLRGVKLTADGATVLGELLQKNKKLLVVDFSENGMDDAGIKAICHGILTSEVGDVSQLEKIDFRKCNFGDEGARHVGAVLSNLRTLKTINLSENSIGDEGIKYIANGIIKTHFDEDAEVLTGLTELDLSSNMFSDAGIIELAKRLPANGTLRKLGLADVGLTAASLEVLTKNIQECGCIEHLNIGRNKIESNRLIAPIADMVNETSSLTSLDLSGIDIGKEDIKLLGEFLQARRLFSLRHLSLSNCNIDDDAAGVIAQGIKHNTVLKELDVTSNPFGPRGAHSFAETFKRAKVLSLFRVTGASRIGTEGENYLALALQYHKTLVIKGTSTELDYMNDFVDRQLAFTENEDGELSGWSEEAWHTVKRGCGAIIGTVINRLSADEFKQFKNNVLRKSLNIVNQTMFEHVLRHADAPAIEVVNTFIAKCGMDLDDACKSKTSYSLAKRQRKSDDVTYRYVALKFARDPRVKALAEESELYLGRYKKVSGPMAYKTCTVERFDAVDQLSEKQKVFVQIYHDDNDFQRERDAREDMKDRLQGGGPFAIYDVILREREIHNDTMAISFDRHLSDLRNALDNLGACAGYDIREMIFLAKRTAQTLGTVNGLNRIHGDFRPRNLMMVARERLGDDPIKGKTPLPGTTPSDIGKKLLPEKWVLFDFSKSVTHSTQVIVHEDSAYMPPEVARVAFNRKGGEKAFPLANEKMDVWNFGVVLYQLLTGTHLFHIEQPLDRLHRKNERLELMNWICLDDARQKIILHRANETVFPNPTIYRRIMEHARDLVNWCLQGNPHHRPNFSQILDHPFFDYKKMVNYTDVDLLLGWYKKMGSSVEDAAHKNNRSHAHIINTAGKHARDITKSLRGYFRAAGCRFTTDEEDDTISIQARREAVQKARTLIILLTNDVFFKPQIIQKILWAMDSSETTCFIPLDISTAGTKAKALNFDELFSKWGKSAEFEALFEDGNLLPLDEKLDLKHLNVGKTAKDLRNFLVTEVRAAFEDWKKRVMPYRSRPFQGQAMVNEILCRSECYTIADVKDVDFSNMKDKGGDEKANVLILYNDSQKDAKLRHTAGQLRKKLLGLPKCKAKVHLVETPREALAHFDQAEDGDLIPKLPTLVLCLVSSGFYDLFRGVLLKLTDAKGAVSLIPISYDTWNPELPEAAEEIANSGLSSRMFLDVLKSPNLYIPLSNGDRGLEYEMNASLSYIYDEASKKLTLTKRHADKKEDEAYVRYENANFMNVNYF